MNKINPIPNIKSKNIPLIGLNHLMWSPQVQISNLTNAYEKHPVNYNNWHFV